MLGVPKDFGLLRSPDGAELTTEMIMFHVSPISAASVLTLIDHGVRRGHPFTRAPAVGGRGAPGTVTALEVAA